MSKERLFSLISQGEGPHLDFKHSINDAKKIACSLSAFANTGGGLLLIGVRDNGSIVGVNSEEEFYMVETASILYCRPQVPFSARQWDIEGKSILEVIIPKSSKRPHLALQGGKEWKAFTRVADENKIASKVQLQVWKNEGNEIGELLKFNEEERWLLNFLQENGFISFSSFRKKINISRFKAEKILVNLISFGVLRIEYVKDRILYCLEDPDRIDEEIPQSIDCDID